MAVPVSLDEVKLLKPLLKPNETLQLYREPVPSDVRDVTASLAAAAYSASSSAEVPANVDHSPVNCKLAKPSQSSAGAWCAGKVDDAQYLQIDLGAEKEVTGLAVLKRLGEDQHVTAFRLAVSADGKEFRTLPHLFAGAPDQDEQGYQRIPNAPIKLRAVRILPAAWFKYLSARVAVFVPTPPPKWVHWPGHLPENTLLGGVQHDGEKLFVARAHVHGGVHPAKCTARGECFYSYGGKEVRIERDFDVLVTERQAKWLSARLNNQELEKHQLGVAGHEADGKPLFVARALHLKGHHPGKYAQHLSGINFPYAGKEHCVPDFEVLSFL